jgi:tetratricopeptide (TPR) repeat protein
MGELLLETGQAADAIPQLEQAVSQSPTAANRFALAAAYMRNSQPAKAVPLLEQAVAGEPQNFDLRLTYGRALRDLRQFSNAAREFFFSAKIKPESVEAWSELAGALILTENYPQALAALDRVRALGGEKAAHLYFRAIILDRSKQYKPALEAYRQFLATSQNQSPDEEFKARQRVRIIQKELSKR